MTTEKLRYIFAPLERLEYCSRCIHIRDVQPDEITADLVWIQCIQPYEYITEDSIYDRASCPKFQKNTL